MTTDSILIRAWRNRTGDYTISLYRADGVTAVPLASGDNVRIKIGENLSTPDLDFDSGDPSTNGTTITFTPGSNVVSLHLNRMDIASLTPGAYDLEICVVDSAVADADESIKHVQSGVFFLHPTQGGSDGMEESSGSSSSS